MPRALGEAQLRPQLGRRRGIQYLPAYQRSIICDVRYLLLILDQYLGAQRLIEELEIVE